MRKGLGLGVALASALFLAPAGSAAVVNVNCARHDLQAKIDAAPPGTTLRVKGTCEPVLISKNLTLDGNPRATIDAAELGRPVTIIGAPVIVLRDFTLTGGRVTDGPGGGLMQAGGTLRLHRVSVVDNVVERYSAAGDIVLASGGGIASLTGSLTITESEVVGNRAVAAGEGRVDARGGGILRNGPLTMRDVQIERNRAVADSAQDTALALAGGAYVAGDLHVTFSRIAGNRAGAHTVDPGSVVSAFGGGIHVAGPSGVVLSRSTVAENRVVASGWDSSVVARGGGLSLGSDGGRIERTTLEGNEARALLPGTTGPVSADGGGASLRGPFTLRRVRVVGSLASARGGASAFAIAGGLSFTEDESRLVLSNVSRNRVAAQGGTSGVARGAGLGSTAELLTVIDSTVSANVAAAPTWLAEGGGMYADDGVGPSGALNLVSSTVSRNRAAGGFLGRGGGLVLASGDLPSEITNSTIAGNRVSGDSSEGGGISSTSDVQVVLTTIARNIAAQEGGIRATTLPVTLRGVIVASNQGGDCGGPTLVSVGRNVFGTASGCPAGGLDQVGPARLGALGAHGGPTQTVLIRRGSPARNSIPAAECPEERDQRGVARPQGTRCDSGAFERRRGRRP